MRRCLPALILAAAAFLAAQEAAAQRIAVQQPVVENFSVGTTVSVPDRGSAMLGGVGSARSGRSQSGPLRSGTSLGWERQGSSASVHVYIHDFEAMDAALLSSGSPQTSRVDRRIANRLQDRRRADVQSIPAPTRELDVAADAERLAEQAEARGKPAVAKLHWQRAARHGSTRAAQRLAETVARRSPN